jgi:hypothetical protein
MGHALAYDLAVLTDLGIITLDQALEVHLLDNCHPPVPLSMLEPCKEAISAVNEDDSSKVISLKGVTINGTDSMEAWALVGYLHLDAFIW